MDDRIYEQNMHIVELTIKEGFAQVRASISEQNTRIETRFQKLETNMHWLQWLAGTLALAVVSGILVAVINGKMLPIN